MSDLPDLSTFAGRVRCARRLRGLTARGLSKLAGLKSEAHVGIIERNPAGGVESDTAMHLAMALGVSLEWLITGKGDMNPRRAASGNG